MTDRLATLTLVAESQAPPPEVSISNPSQGQGPQPPMSYPEVQRRKGLLRAAQKPIPLIRAFQNPISLVRTPTSVFQKPIPLIRKPTPACKRPIPLIRKLRPISSIWELRRPNRYVLKHKTEKYKLDHTGERLPTIGDLGLDNRPYHSLVIRMYTHVLILARDRRSKVAFNSKGQLCDINYNHSLLIKFFAIMYPKPGHPSNATMTEEENAILLSYGLPEVDALLNPVYGYWTFRRLMLAHCTHIPEHYRLYAGRYILEAMKLGHVSVVEKAHLKGLQIHLVMGAPTISQFYLRTIEWIIKAGLLGMYCQGPSNERGGCQGPSNERRGCQEPVNPVYGPHDVPPMVKLIFIHDREELLELILNKYCHKINSDVVNYAHSLNAHRCLQLMSQFQ